MASVGGLYTCVRWLFALAVYCLPCNKPHTLHLVSCLLSFFLASHHICLLLFRPFHLGEAVSVSRGERAGWVARAACARRTSPIQSNLAVHPHGLGTGTRSDFAFDAESLTVMTRRRRPFDSFGSLLFRAPCMYVQHKVCVSLPPTMPVGVPWYHSHLSLLEATPRWWAWGGGWLCVGERRMRRGETGLVGLTPLKIA